MKIKNKDHYKEILKQTRYYKEENMSTKNKNGQVMKRPAGVRTPFGIKLAYSLGDAGFSFMWGVVSSFVTLYYTDSVGLSAAFAGTMMLVCRVFDGVSDLLAGAIIEKTNSKLGKCRFWLVVSIVPLAISMILMFSVPPEASLLSKEIYATVTYIFMTVICFTMAYVAYSSLLSRFTSDPDDVVSISTLRVVLAIGTSMLVGMVMINVLNAMGGISSPYAWRRMAITFTAVGFLFQLTTAIFVKERNTDIQEKTAEEIPQQKEKRKLLPLFKMVLANRNFWLLMMEFALVNLVTFASINAYFARDVLGDANLVGMITLASMGPVIILQFVLAPLVRKFGKRRCMLVGGAMIIIMGIMITLRPTSQAFVLTGMVIGGFGRGVFMGLIYTLTADLVDYFKAETGEEIEGVCYSTTSIGTKVGAGLMTAIVGWTLQLGHYDASLAVQADVTKNAMIALIGPGNLIVGILMFLGVYFFNLNHKNKNMK